MPATFKATADFYSTAWTGISESACSGSLDVRTHRVARPRGAFLAAELALLSFALLQAPWGVDNLGPVILTACCALFFHINRMDRSIVTSSSRPFLIDIIESVFLGLLASVLLFHALPDTVPRVDIAIFSVLLISLLPVAVRWSLRHLVTRGRFVEEVLIVGTGDLPAKLHRALGRSVGHSERNRKVLEVPDSLADGGTAVHLTELRDLVVGDQISRVVIAERDTQNRERLAAALLDSRLRVLQVNDAIEFYAEVSGKIWVEALNPQWFVYTNGFDCSQSGNRLKRCFDLAFVLVLILLTAPLLVLIAIAIKLDSQGPVFFPQIRVGLYGKTFVIYKFRSMRHDAELESGPSWAAVSDDRVTRVGRVLRTFHLDELPQAFNVLKGDMSMVGPRPERPCFVSFLEKEIPLYNLRHYLKPGITGWAQVMCRYGASVRDSYEKLQYDFYYAKHKSFRLDAAILLKTIRVVLLGRGR